MLKYFIDDFKATNSGLISLYLTTLISSLLVLLTSSYKNSVDFLTAIYVIAMGVSTICLLVCLILPFFRFFLNIHSIFEERDIKKYDAKVMTLFVTIVVSFLIIFVAFVNTYSNHTVFKFARDLFMDPNLAKNFSTFCIELGVNTFLIYMSALIGMIIGENSKNDKIVRAIIITFTLIAFNIFFIKFLVQLIVFERKYILKIMLYLLVCSALYFVGKYEYKLKNEIGKKNNNN